MNDNELVASISDELFWDPKVDSEAIAVSADGGIVTVRGTVGSFREKREAAKAAERVYGVLFVDNDLDVRILTEHRREDADVRGAVLQALTLDTLIPDTVDATVKDGIVTLTGTTTWQFQRNEAEFVAGNILGVTGVLDKINLDNPTPDVGNVKHSIKKALQRDAKLDADTIDVESTNGTVQLTGSVGSWSEHDTALAAAWAAPGVINVDDRINVRY